MMIAFYMDVHVPRAITIGLRLRKIDVLTAQEDQRRTTPDPLLLDRATELNRLIFTQDDDFLKEAQKRQQQGIEFTGIIYIHHQQLIIGNCIQDLELIAKIGTPQEFANRVQFLPF